METRRTVSQWNQLRAPGGELGASAAESVAYWLLWGCLVSVAGPQPLPPGLWALQPSYYLWWLAPAAMLCTAPRERPEASCRLLVLVVLSWSLVQFSDRLLDAIYDWYGWARIPTIRNIRLGAAAITLAVVPTLMFAPLLERAFGSLALRAAFAVGASAAAVNVADELLDMSTWTKKPAAGIIIALSNVIGVLVLMAASDRRRRAASQGNNQPGNGLPSRPPWTRITGVILTGILSISAYLLLSTDTRPKYWDAMVPRRLISQTAMAVLVLYGVTTIAKRGCDALLAAGLRRTGQVVGVLQAGRWLVLAGAAGVWIGTFLWAAPAAGQGFEMLLSGLSGPRFRVTVDASARKVIFVGTLSYGAADDVADVLAEHDRIQFMEISSPGGLLPEGVALARVVEERDLVTIVRAKCDSACVIAFAAGRERWLADQGTLGLHAAALTGVGMTGIDDQEADVFRRHGIDMGLVSAWASAAPWDTARPSIDELVGSRLVTRVLSQNDVEATVRQASAGPSDLPASVVPQD